MNIQKIQLQKTHQLKSDSQDYSSFMKSEADQSKHTYTAIIFNDTIKPSVQESFCKYRKQLINCRQYAGTMESNKEIEDLLKINSLSKLAIKQKNVRNSATIFVNVRLNNSIDRNNVKTFQRPVSAFTKTNKQLFQCLQLQQNNKECSSRESRELSLAGKNYFQESNTKIQGKEKDGQSTYHRLEHKIIQTSYNHGYIAKSRLLSSKQGKRSSHHIQLSDKQKPKQIFQYDSSVNFQSLHKNLLINNKSAKNKDNCTSKSQYFHKRQKYSFKGSLKTKQNFTQKINQEKAKTLIVINNDKNSIYTLADKNQTNKLSKESESKYSFFTNSFHKHHSKILKSMKKGKCKKEKMLQLTKESVVEPKLLIENVDLGKHFVESSEKTPSNASYASSQKNITKYLTKLSYSMNKKKKTFESDPNCRLTVQCKKVTYF